MRCNALTAEGSRCLFTARIKDLCMKHYRMEVD